MRRFWLPTCSIQAICVHVTRTVPILCPGPSPPATAPPVLPAGDTRKRTLLVDDHAVVRFGISQLINRQPDLVVCGEEEDASKALGAITNLKPDLVIADLSLKDSSGLELMRNIRAQFPKLPILVVSVHDETIYAEMAFRAGALGYLNKDEAIDKILTAIRRVLNGEV